MQLTQLLWQSVPNSDGIREERVPIDLCPCILDKGQVWGENAQNLTGLYFSPLFRILYIRTIPFKKDKNYLSVKNVLSDNPLKVQPRVTVPVAQPNKSSAFRCLMMLRSELF